MPFTSDIRTSGSIHCRQLSEMVAQSFLADPVPLDCLAQRRQPADRRALLNCVAAPLKDEIDMWRLKIASWNLGWHLSGADAQTWAMKCSAPFAQDSTSLWRPAASGTHRASSGRDVLPPCNVYSANFKTVPITERHMGAGWCKYIDTFLRAVHVYADLCVK